MGGSKAFQVEAVVKAARPNGTFSVELSNGHELTAFVAGPDRKIFTGGKTGDLVKLQLTPYDLSVGRILVEK